MGSPELWVQRETPDKNKVEIWSSRQATGSCPSRCWEPNLGSQEEQDALTTTDYVPSPYNWTIRVVYSLQSISTSESAGMLEATGKFLTVGGFREKLNRIWVKNGNSSFQALLSTYS